MSCPTTTILERLARGLLKDEERIWEHARECGECVWRIERLAKDNPSLAREAKERLGPEARRRLLKLEEGRTSLAARLWKPFALSALALLLAFAVYAALDFSRPRAGSDEIETVLVCSSCPAMAPEGPRALAEIERPRDVFERRGIPSDDRSVPSSDEPAIFFPEAAVGDHSESADSEDFHSMKGEAAGIRGRQAGRSAGVYDSVGVGSGGSGRYGGRSAGSSAASARDASGRDVRKRERKLPTDLPPPAAEGAEGTIFKGTGVNPTFDTAIETTSTFGLDVDTASYTIVRRFLKERGLPPPEAVRVEEFLNYFRYADPKPPKGAFQVRLEAAPSPFDAERHLLRIAVQAKEITEKERKDCVLTFVIDVSGSMSMENRLALVKRSLHCLVERLRPTDKVGIVVYGTNGRKLLDPTPARHKAQILGVIDDLRTEGSTNLEDGVNIGYALASNHFDPKATNRVIICTDGVANNGVVDPPLLLKNVAVQASKGIWLSVLGFGMGNMNDALMEELADKGNGNYAYIDRFEEAKKIFTEKLVGMMEVVAADAKVQVEFDPKTVAEFRQIGYEKRRLANADFRNDKVDAGEVGANHHVIALYEIKLKPGAEGRLATVRLRYREPDTKEVVESQESLGRGQVLAAVKDATPSYRLAASVAAFAEILRKSPAAERMTLAQVLEQASRAAADLDRPEDAVELLDLVKRAAELRK